MSKIKMSVRAVVEWHDEESKRLIYSETLYHRHVARDEILATQKSVQTTFTNCPTDPETRESSTGDWFRIDINKRGTPDE